MKTNDQIKINDQVTSADLFNIEDYTNGLAEYIRKCSAPMTIAIQGSWGSGKISMMRRIQKAINDDCCWIEVNTWQYSQFDLGNNLPLVFYKCLIEKNISTIADKCTRTFGKKANTQISGKRFEELVKGFLDKNEQSPELIELLTDAVKHSRDADKEEVVRSAFLTLREEKVLSR